MLFVPSGLMLRAAGKCEPQAVASAGTGVGQTARHGQRMGLECQQRQLSRRANVVRPDVPRATVIQVDCRGRKVSCACSPRR